MSAGPIEIELLNPPDRVPVGEPVPLHLLIRCPDGGKPAALRNVGTHRPAAVAVDADLFERDIVLGPGEVYRCAVLARFLAPGNYREPLFFVQVGEDKDAALVQVPMPPVRAVPSLAGEVKVLAESICTYELGTKVDVTLTHAGVTRFTDFRLTVGPAEVVHTGVSDRRRPALEPGDVVRFTAVLDANAMELVLDATAAGVKVGPVTVRVPVPPVRDDTEAREFRFLEPRKLTQADVRIRTTDDAREEVKAVSGAFPVHGSGTRYRVEVRPAHPHATAVRLRSVSGSVDVTDLPAEAGVWAFHMVVLTNDVLTTPVTLYFDVATPDGPQQGELNLAIRPTSLRGGLFALKVGGALSVKGLIGVVGVLGAAAASPMDELADTLSQVRTSWDLLYLLTAPIIWAGVWVVDRVIVAVQDA